MRLLLTYSICNLEQKFKLKKFLFYKAVTVMVLIRDCSSKHGARSIVNSVFRSVKAFLFINSSFTNETMIPHPARRVGQSIKVYNSKRCNCQAFYPVFDATFLFYFPFNFYLYP